MKNILGVCFIWFVFLGFVCGEVIVFDDFNDDPIYGQPSNPPWNTTTTPTNQINRVDPDSSNLFGQGLSNKFLRMRQLSGSGSTMIRGIRNLNGGLAAVIISFDFYDFSNDFFGTPVSFYIGGAGTSPTYWERFDFQSRVVKNSNGLWLSSLYAMQTKHSIRIVVNNTSNNLYYDNFAEMVTSGAYDLWLNGTKIMNDIPKQMPLAKDLNIQSFEFRINNFSSGGSREFYFDNFKVESGDFVVVTCAGLDPGIADILGCRYNINDLKELALNWLYSYSQGSEIILNHHFNNDTSNSSPANPPWNVIVTNPSNQINRVEMDGSNLFQEGTGNKVLHMKIATNGTVLSGIRNYPNTATAVVISFDFVDTGTDNAVPIYFFVGGPGWGTTYWERFEFRGNIIRNFNGEWLSNSYLPNVKHTMVIFANNSSIEQTYYNGTESVAPGTYDLWLDGQKIQDNKPKVLSMGLDIPFQDFEFRIDKNTTTGVREVYFDNLRVNSKTLFGCSDSDRVFDMIGDWSGPQSMPDCQVNMFDFATVAKDWYKIFEGNQTEAPVLFELLNNNVKDASGTIVYSFATVSPLIKVRPKVISSLNNAQLGNQIFIRCAGGEYESSQIVIYSPRIDLQNVVLTASSLQGPNGSTISASHIGFYPVGFVFNNSSDTEKNGYWPDPILEFLTSFTIAKKDLQPLWYRVFVPVGTPPGLYSGNVTIAPVNAPSLVIPVQVEVRNFSLPRMSYHRVVVHYATGFSDTFVMKYKINPGRIYNSNCPTESDFQLWAQNEARAFNIKYIDTMHLDPVTKMPRPGDLDAWCSQIAQALIYANKYGIRNRAFVYLFDELMDTSYLPAFQQISSRLKNDFPNLLQLTTAFVDLSWTGQGVGLETVGAWCPPIHLYNFNTAQNARNLGRQVWWYTSNQPADPYPNTFLTEPAINTRMLMGFMAAGYRSDGYLFYLIHPLYNLGSIQIGVGPYTGWQSNCDGREEGLGQWCFQGPQGIIPTQRLETIRDGLEDYDYLVIAKQSYENLLASQIPVPPQISNRWQQIESFWTPSNVLMENLTAYNRSLSFLNNVREDIAQFIEDVRSLIN